MAPGLSVFTFFLGALSLSAQLVLTRELVTSFSGNEVVYAIVISLWIAFAAAGSYSFLFFRRISKDGQLVIYLQLMMFLTFAWGVVVSRAGPSLMGLPFGQITALSSVVGVSALAVLPAAFISGLQFVIVTSIIRAKDDAPARSSYPLESAGSMTAGLLLSSLAFIYMNSVMIFASLLGIFMILVLVLGVKGKKVPVMIICGALLLAAQAADKALLKTQYFPYMPVWEAPSPYGDVAVTENTGDRTVFQSGKLVAPSADSPLDEEYAAMSAIQQKSPKAVLVISGPPGLIKRLIQINGVLSLDVLEPDPVLIKAYRYIGGNVLSDKRISVINDDPVRHIKMHGRKYDLIILGGVEPGNLISNRTFTAEFLRSASSRLAEGGVLSLRLPVSDVFIPKETALMNASVKRALESSFSYTVTVAGSNNYMFGALSSGVLTSSKDEMASRYKELAMGPGYFSNEILGSFFMPMRQESISRQLSLEAPVNTTLFPVPYMYSRQLWARLSGPWSARALEYASSADMRIVSGMLFLAVFALMSAGGKRGDRARTYLAMFLLSSSGLMASMVLLFLYQSYYGSLFRMIGLLIAAYMAGLAVSSRYLGRVRMTAMTALSAAFALVFISIYLIISGGAELPGWSIVALSFLSALPTGAYFAYASKGLDQSMTAKLYSADLAGGCVSGFAVVIATVPAWGMTGTIVFASVCSIAAALLISRRRVS